MLDSSRSDPNLQPVLNLQPALFEAIRNTLASYSGIYLDRMNQRVLMSSLSKRTTATRMPLEAYAAHITRPAGQSELQQLVELLLNHETVFFRNRPHVRALKDVILPRMHRQKPANEPIRIWSAGCSTGEEPYSLAIIALETLGHPFPRNIEIHATDLSQAALARARTGAYRGRTLSNVTAPMLTHYFDQRAESRVVKQHVREIITFEQHNLLEPFPPWAMDLDIIFCQNVTIYFQVSTFRMLVDRFYRTLRHDGILFLGFSETLWNIYDQFRLQEIAGAFMYVKAPLATPEPPSAVTRQPPSTRKPLMPDALVSSHRSSIPKATPTQQPHTKTTRSFREERKTTGLSAANLEKPPPVSPLPGNEIVQRGQSLLADGQADEVLHMLYNVPLNDSYAPQILALIARAHANRGDFELAVAEARRTLELDVLTTEAYILLGILYAQQGQIQEAAQQLERARFLDAESPLISYHLAEVYRQLDRVQPAIREYRNTLRKLQTWSNDTLLDGVAVGWIKETCERYLKILTQKR
ncbi:MAG: tetratricopeptide repeat protein [Chloroflexaceae bacterium]|nr:tetratricopeptide repeat protein [Chloroflexaceae bacterium]